MVEPVVQNNKTVYQCEVCGFHYEQKEMAQKCEEWCGKRYSCNIEIIKYAIENREQ